MILELAATFLMVLTLATLVRVVRGPTAADRMLGAQLGGTTAIAVLVILGVVRDQSAFVNVALVFAILAAVALIAFVTSTGRRDGA